MRKLGEHTLPIGTGVMTKYNPIQAAGGFARQAQNVDSFDEPLSFGTIPGSVKVTTRLPGSVVSLHQFEYSDRAGVRHWKQLVLASDGSMHVRDNSTSVPLVPGSSDVSYGEALCSTDFADRKYLSSPNQLKWATGGKKYDGTNLRNWGLLAPGQKPILLDKINLATTWVAATDSIRFAVQTPSINGYGSIQVDKTGTTTNRFGRISATVAWDVEGNDGQFYIYLYLPDGALQHLASDRPAVEVVLGSGGFANTNVYNADIGTLVPGWNFLAFVSASPDSITGTGAVESAVTDVRLDFWLTSQTDVLSGVLWNYAHQMVNGAPTPGVLGAVGSGSVVGDVSYRITYLSETGVISNSGSTSATVTASNQDVELVGIPVSDDPQVIARQFYRDRDGDAIFRFVAQLDDNITTEFTDNVLSASLGGATAPIAGDDELDSSAPPHFVDCVTFENRIFGIDASDRRIVWVSDVASPEQFRLVDQITVDEALQSLTAHTSGLMLCGSDRWYVMSGDGVNQPFSAVQLSGELGTNSFRSITKAKSFIWTLREKEVFLVQDPRDSWYLSANIQDQLDALDLSDAFMVHDRARRRALLFWGTNEALSYQYGSSGKGSVDGAGYGVDEQDLRLGSWFRIKLPATVIPRTAILAEGSSEVPTVYIGCSDGFVYSLDEITGLGWTTETGVEQQEFIWESYGLPLGPAAAFSGRGDARYIEIDSETSVASSWNCTITSLTAADGVSLGSVTFPITFQSGQASAAYPVPEGLISGGWARVKLQSAGVVSSRVIVRGIRMAYISTARRWGVRSA